MHELIELADSLDHQAFEFEAAPFQASLEKLRDAATAIAPSWSGSNLGYQACVYYANFEPPPPGAHFSAEWGVNDAVSMGTRGDWRQYNSEDVKRMILTQVGNPDLTEPRKQSKAIQEICERAKHDLSSQVTLAIDEKPDTYLRSLITKVENVKVFSASDFEHLSLPNQVMSRDRIAMGQGLRVAPHQAILCSLAEIASPIEAARELAQLARQAGSHLVRLDKRSRREKLVGTNVFIGHGRAFAWRDLKDFIGERLKLPYDEFNRVPVAGITNIARLSEMLESAAVAFIILTAEDEQADSRMHARLNVIHEVGLFQGRLGFTKAIVLVEEGCEQFSNIDGLGQIRFPKGNISAAFEEVRRVLEREGLI